MVPTQTVTVRAPLQTPPVSMFAHGMRSCGPTWPYLDRRAASRLGPIPADGRARVGAHGCRAAKIVQLPASSPTLTARRELDVTVAPTARSRYGRRRHTATVRSAASNIRRERGADVEDLPSVLVPESRSRRTSTSRATSPVARRSSSTRRSPAASRGVKARTSCCRSPRATRTAPSSRRSWTARCRCSCRRTSRRAIRTARRGSSLRRGTHGASFRQAERRTAGPMAARRSRSSRTRRTRAPPLKRSVSSTSISSRSTSTLVARLHPPVMR